MNMDVKMMIMLKKRMEEEMKRYVVTDMVACGLYVEQCTLFPRKNPHVEVTRGFDATWSSHIHTIST